MNKTSQLILCFIMMGFLAAFTLELPGTFFEKIKTNVDSFSGYVAANYNDAAGANMPVYANTKDLTDIAPAAGDEAPADATKTPASDEDALKAPTPVLAPAPTTTEPK